MSEVSKKRIVSNENSIETSDVQLTSDSNGVSLNSKTDDISLQDIIEAEFNSRLSNIADNNESHLQCMSPNNEILENNSIVETPDIMTSSPSNAAIFDYPEPLNIKLEPTENIVEDKIKFETIAFLNNEKQFCVISMTPNVTTEPNTDQLIETQSPSVKINEENSIVKETCDEINEESSSNTETKPEKPSIKDKLMLGNDEQMALLFSQTIRSPAFTPTDENFDIIQAIKREENSVDEFVKIENLCRDESFELKQEEISDETLNRSTESSNGEISPEDEREISQGSDLSVTLGDENNSFEIISTIKTQEPAYENIHIVANGVVTPDLIESCEDVIQEEDENELEIEENGQSPVVETNGGSEDVIEEEVEVVESPLQESEEQSENGIDDTDDSNHMKVSGNAFLVNDKKSHECSLTTNSAKLVLNLVNTTSTMETTVTETIENVTTNGNGIENKSQVKKKKSKKSKKDHEKENISVKSSFSKFDALSKKTVLHVRSSDAGKAQEKFNGSNQSEQNCKSCGRQVFQMEQIKAEKAIWHKNCFRCKECNKQLTLDTYQSHEGTVYCKPHFKALFAPKVVEDTQPPSDKPDLGLEELQSLNVKSRFQVFEQANEQHENSLERTPSNVNVKRSASILSKLAKFQSKGMDIGVTDDSLNGIPIENSSDESEESDDGIEGEDADLIRAQRKTAQKEQPVHFDKLKDLKSQWETGNQMTREERREERKQEIQSIRSRLFMGKQGKMKEMYQQAVAESESGANVKKQVATEVSEQARLIKEKFEKGEISNDEVKKSTEEDMSVFDAGISKKSRSLFLELDANAGKTPQVVPLTPVKSSADVKKAREENSPEREIYRDPDIVRAEEIIEDPLEAAKTHTATKMLSLFRQMEEKSQESTPAGPKPLKCFTPPPEPQRDESESEEEDVTDEDEEESENENENPNIVRAADKPTDEFLINAQNAARAKQLRAKFERWEENEIRKEQRDQNSSAVNLAEECSEEQIETAKSLRARFESMRETSSTKVEKQSRVKVNRFVDVHAIAENCDVCHKRVYPLEKVECDSKMYHKQCFRCLQCNAILRMDSYTLNQGMLFCIPHFKQLFIAKGNYETGFGLDQHKSKWEQHYHQTNGVQTANATL